MLIYPDTQFLRALGMILIINSHLDLYYPIPHIGTGGAIGNSIFFFLSAYGIYLSQQKKRKHFSEWLKGRISRIYPSMWIVLFFLQLPIMLKDGRLTADYILTFIGLFFSSPHWFIRALLVFYLLSFYFLKDNQKNKLLSALGGLGILYFACYFTWVDLSKWSAESLPFCLIQYFGIFLFGIYVASRRKPVTYTGLHNYLIPLVFVAIIYGHKYLMTKGLYQELQFIQQVSMYPLMYYLLKISRSPFVLSSLMKYKLFSRVVKFISDHTLELYIIHETISGSIVKLKFSFPLNVMTFLILTFTFSIIVNKFSKIIRERIT